MKRKAKTSEVPAHGNDMLCVTTPGGGWAIFDPDIVMGLIPNDEDNGVLLLKDGCRFATAMSLNAVASSLQAARQFRKAGNQ